MGSHLSIGEVLGLLQAEFPDVTISKIRFLESQGLLVPERTPSGYRKFYEADIDRLRWILTQQREHFLPLKVIKDRLGEEVLGEEMDQPEAGEDAHEGSNGERSVDLNEAAAYPTESADSSDTTAPIWMADLARQTKRSKVSAGVASGEGSGQQGSDPASGSRHSSPSAENRRAARRADVGGGGRAEGPVPSPLDAGATTVSLTAAELASAAGLEPSMVRELEQYGLIVGQPAGNDRLYDADALIVAQKAATFLQYGVQPRHLRMYKQAAEREASVLEQVVMPMLKHRNAGARHQALDLLGDLALMGQNMRAALLRTALRDHLDSTKA